MMCVAMSRASSSINSRYCERGEREKEKERDRGSERESVRVRVSI